MGTTRTASGRRARWALPVVAGVAVCLSPGVAAADPPDGLTPGHGTVTPFVDCVRLGSGGAYTAVLGYRNDGTATEHLRGADNVLAPSRYDGSQPTKFDSGTHHGVFTVQVASGSVSWTLDGTTVVVSASAPACPPGSELPADGNGTGPAIALVGAGAVGVLAVWRARRRSTG